MEYKKIINRYTEISKRFKNYKGFISEGQYSRIENFPFELEQKINNNIEKNEVLKIGIVGQVKSGKSSFLNAMLFEGKEILPKAATPMTASLTKISYAQELKAEINFYTKKDWEIISKTAFEYRNCLEEYIKEQEEKHNLNASRADMYYPEFNRQFHEKTFNKNIDEVLKACNELVENAKNNDKILTFLGKEKMTIDGVKKLEDLNKELMNYVGPKGEYTPIVKSISIYLNLDELKGLEIVDTPGTNDPIISRGMETQRNLSECDLVLLLSYSSQFMTDSDYRFIVNTLPNSGIRRAYILGSKFDSALLDYDKSSGNIAKAYKEVARSLSSQALEVIEKGLKNSPNSKILKNIKNNLPPQFISSMCFEIGKNMPHNNEEQKHILNQLEHRYMDGKKLKSENLFELSNIQRTKEKCLGEARRDKDEILKNKLGDLVSGQRDEFLNIMLDTQERIEELMNKLQNLEINEISKRYELINNTLKGINYDVRDIFSEILFNSEKKLKELIIEINEATTGRTYTNIDITMENIEVYSHSTGLFFWKQEHRKTMPQKTATINDCIENCNKFLVEVNKMVNGITEKLIDKRELEKKLKSSIESIFLISRKNISSQEIIVPLKEAINLILIPKIDINKNDYLSIIEDEFSRNIVEGNEDIERLKRCQGEILHKISQDVEKQINNFKLEFSRTLKGISSSFIDNFQDKLKDEKETLMAQAKDKEKSLKIYEEVLNYTKDIIKEMTRGDYKWD